MKFEIRSTEIETWSEYYVVEAPTRQEAIRLVKQGLLTPVSREIMDSEFDMVTRVAELQEDPPRSAELNGQST